MGGGGRSCDVVIDECLYRIDDLILLLYVN